MASKERQMTLDEIQAQVQEKVGPDWRVTVKNDANGKVQIRTQRKTP